MLSDLFWQYTIIKDYRFLIHSTGRRAMKCPWQKLTNSQVCSTIQQLHLHPLKGSHTEHLFNLTHLEREEILFSWFSPDFKSFLLGYVLSQWQLDQHPWYQQYLRNVWEHTLHVHKEQSMMPLPPWGHEDPRIDHRKPSETFLPRKEFSSPKFVPHFPIKTGNPPPTYTHTLDPLGEIPSCKITTQAATNASLQAATAGNVKKSQRNTYQMQSAPVCK